VETTAEWRGFGLRDAQGTALTVDRVVDMLGWKDLRLKGRRRPIFTFRRFCV
jgi:hypothetical protein